MNWEVYQKHLRNDVGLITIIERKIQEANKMAKYRKKPIVVEAFQWIGENNDFPDWFIEKLKDGTVKIQKEFIEVIGDNALDLDKIEVKRWAEIQTLEGIMKADIGDYIIKGVKGEIYPCKPDIFEETYEKVEEEKRIPVIRPSYKETHGIKTPPKTPRPPKPPSQK